jgi:hypothetical protein
MSCFAEMFAIRIPPVAGSMLVGPSNQGTREDERIPLFGDTRQSDDMARRHFPILHGMKLVSGGPPSNELNSSCRPGGSAVSDIETTTMEEFESNMSEV